MRGHHQQMGKSHLRQMLSNREKPKKSHQRQKSNKNPLPKRRARNDCHEKRRQVALPQLPTKMGEEKPPLGTSPAN